MIPGDEEKRLQLIHDLNILQHFQNDESFEKMTLICTEFFKVPIALITIVADKSVWFLTNVGLEAMKEGIRETSFCTRVIERDAPESFVVTDASQDDRFKENPAVTGSLHLRFYAASPIYLQDVKVGTICLIDTIPRNDFTREKEKRLLEIARNISDMMTEKKLEFVDNSSRGNSQMVMDVMQNLTTDFVDTLKDMISTQEELRHLHKTIVELNKPTRREPKTTTPTAAVSEPLNELELLTQLETKKQELFENRLHVQSMLQKGLISLNNLIKTTPGYTKQHSDPNNNNNSKKPFNNLTVKPNAVFLPPHDSFIRGEYLSLPQWFNKLKQLTINQLPHYHLIGKHVKWDLKMNSYANNIAAYEVNEGILPFLSMFMSFLLICQSQKWKRLTICFVLYPQNESISPPNSRRSSTATRCTTQSSDLDDSCVNNAMKGGKRVFHACTGKPQEDSFHLSFGKLAIELKASGKIKHNKSVKKTVTPIAFSPSALSLSGKNTTIPQSNIPSSLSTSMLPASDHYPLFPEENQFFSICDNFIANSFQIIQGEYQKYYNPNEEITNCWVACFLKENILPVTATTTNNATSLFSPRKKLQHVEEQKDAQKTIKSNSSFINQQLNRVGSFVHSSINLLLLRNWRSPRKQLVSLPASSSSPPSDARNKLPIPMLKPLNLSLHSHSDVDDSEEKSDNADNSGHSLNKEEELKSNALRTKDTLVEEFSGSYQKSLGEDDNSRDVQKEDNDLIVLQKPVLIKPKSLLEDNNRSPADEVRVSGTNSVQSTPKQTPRQSRHLFFPSSKVHISSD